VNNDNGRKHNKRPTKGKEKKYLGAFFHTKMQKMKILEFIVMKI
jgi:hypothetical protein